MASCGGHNAPGRRPVWRRRPAAANERMRDTNSATQTLPGALNDRPPHSARRRAWLGARRRTETRRPLQAAGRRWGLRALCASGPDGPAAFTCLVLGQEVCGTQGTTSPPPPAALCHGASKRRSVITAITTEATTATTLRTTHHHPRLSTHGTPTPSTRELLVIGSRLSNRQSGGLIARGCVIIGNTSPLEQKKN
jgi:hypothetical protein